MIIFIPLGIIASIFQLVLLREFSFSIAKHELAFVLATGIWIIFCSLGSIVKLPKKLLKLKLPVAASLCFSCSICLIHLAKSLIGLKYFETASPGAIACLSLALVGPPAFIIGFTFKQFVQRLIKTGPAPNNALAKFFAFEAMGFFLGGAIFTLFFKDYANPLLFSLLPILLLPDLKTPFQKALSAILIIMITAISVVSFNAILKKEFDNAQIFMNLGSRYGPIIASGKSGVTTLFSAGSLLATSEDKPATEEFIHMSLSATEPLVDKDILFIGAAVSGQIDEISKYKLSSLDCLQINPLIWKFTQNLAWGKPNNKINYITDDPRAYLKKTGKLYDAVLMSMPAPASLALNRYFTEEFFRLITKRLKPQGIFSFFMPSKREILSPRFVKFNSSIINALDRVFTHKLIIPSDSMIVIASNGRQINDQYLLDNFSATKPKTEFFTIYHFKDYLTPQLRSYTQNMLDQEVTPNSDLNPSGFLNYLILEQVKFYPHLKIDLARSQAAIAAFFLLCGLFIIIIGCLSPKASGLLNIGAIGFTSISLSSIFFILFQLFCGALFWKLGFLIAVFMGGIAIGVFLMDAVKTAGADLLWGVYLGWMMASFILLVNLKSIGGSDLAEPIFYLYALLCGSLTGSAYPLLALNLIKNKFKHQDIPAIIYSADLIGAFLGTLACGILLLPFLGIPYSLLVLISLNAIFTLRNLRR